MHWWNCMNQYQENSLYEQRPGYALFPKYKVLKINVRRKIHHFASRKLNIFILTFFIWMHAIAFQSLEILEFGIPLIGSEETCRFSQKLCVLLKRDKSTFICEFNHSFQNLPFLRNLLKDTHRNSFVFTHPVVPKQNIWYIKLLQTVNEYIKFCLISVNGLKVIKKMCLANCTFNMYLWNEAFVDQRLSKLFVLFLVTQNRR